MGVTNHVAGALVSEVRRVILSQSSTKIRYLSAGVKPVQCGGHVPQMTGVKNEQMRFSDQFGLSECCFGTLTLLCSVLIKRGLSRIASVKASGLVLGIQKLFF